MQDDDVDLWQWSKDLGSTPFMVICAQAAPDGSGAIRALIPRNIALLLAHQPQIIDYICEVIRRTAYVTKPKDDWPSGISIRAYDGNRQ